jgi:hypothetical protein
LTQKSVDSEDAAMVDPLLGSIRTSEEAEDDRVRFL